MMSRLTNPVPVLSALSQTQCFVYPYPRPLTSFLVAESGFFVHAVAAWTVRLREQVKFVSRA